MLDTIESAIEDIKQGKLVVVVDDEDRENEGDFVTAARNATPELVNFMSKYGRGLICASLPEERCEALGLDLMVRKNTALHETAFTVSVDLLGDDCGTGISAQDRSRTILALINPETKPEQLARPGHIFPLISKKGGVLRRAGHTEAATDLARLQAVQQELATLQGETPLILPTVDYQAVAAVVGDWTGIPVGRMARNEIETILNVAKHLGERVIGQDHAMEMIAKRIQTSRAGLDNPSKPIGVFMLAGTSGVGKTETALALAEALYGGEQNLIVINMSEYQEAHTVSSLKGAPPGYVGYGEGGVLTEAVRRKPYSVVLLDEVEKAHPDVHELFFQVFDKGSMEDGEGRRIDFRNTLILLTSNVGSELIMKLCADPDLAPAAGDLGTDLARADRAPLAPVVPRFTLGAPFPAPGTYGGVAAADVDDFKLNLPTQALSVLAGINGAITGFIALVVVAAGVGYWLFAG